jgi:hypothetical protein
MDFEEGQQLTKRFDRRIVTIVYVGHDCIELDGDFEPKHVVMKDKVLSYYNVILASIVNLFKKERRICNTG